MSEPLVAKISLKKLSGNLKSVKSLMKKKVRLCAVVKSDAYGHGIVKIASAIYKECDYFAVSMLSECEKLRISGIDKPVIILTPPTENTVEKLILLDITLPVSTLKELILVYKTARRLNKRVKVHFAINSGMNRLGFDSEGKIDRAINFIKKNSFIILDGAYSHFSCVENATYTKKCFLTFKRLSKRVKEHNKNAILHISSSGGLLLDRKYQLDMVRIGLLLYGYSPIESNVINVEPIMQVFAKNLLSRDNLAGKNLMYGSDLSKADSVSIIRLGYADGFWRFNTGEFKSNLCMDLSAVKKTDGSYVCVLKNANQTAKELKTIPYEILVSVSKRAKKEYFY